MLSTIAFRNIFRNRRRSAITLLVMVFGVTALILFGGYKEISFRGVRESMIRGRFGHLQVYGKGYLQGDSHKSVAEGLTNIDSIRKALETDARVETTAAQISLVGLLSNGDESETFLATAVEPEKDKQMPAQRLVSGKFLSDTEPDGIILGDLLAKSLGVVPGDPLTILTTTVNGSLNGMDVRVAGIFSTGVREYDERALKMTLPAAQKLLHTDRIERLLVMLKNTEDTQQFEADFTAMAGTRSWPVETRNWSQLAPFYHQVVALYNGIFGFLGIVVSVIVVLSVANTIMMSIFERTREIGTLMAIGTKRRRIWAMFLLEGLFVGVLGGILGVMGGSGLAGIINYANFVLPPPPGYTEGYPLQILLKPSILITAMVVALVTATVSSVVPAFKACRLAVVDALGHI